MRRRGLRSSGSCACPPPCRTCSRPSRFPPPRASSGRSSARVRAASATDWGGSSSRSTSTTSRARRSSGRRSWRPRSSGSRSSSASGRWRSWSSAVGRGRRRDKDGGPAGGVRMTLTDQSVVQLQGVDKVFGGGDQPATTALEGIDLAIRAGEFVSLIGPSGCGKSTLLRIIGDLTAPTRGTVVVNGKPADRARRDRDYGMVFQAPVLFEWRTVEDNVKLPLEIQGAGSAKRTARAREMLELVELGDFLGHYPYQLSGGMQQRVAIARALAFEPAILLMDEPFGALDEMTRERMNSEVLRIWERTGTTVVFVTHSIPEAVFLSSRVVVMSARPGRITKVIDVDLPRPRNEETRETRRYFELVTEVREALRAGGGALDDRELLGGDTPSVERTAAEGAVG